VMFLAIDDHCLGVGTFHCLGAVGAAGPALVRSPSRGCR
jgi:hypothetical protein